MDQKNSDFWNLKVSQIKIIWTRKILDVLILKNFLRILEKFHFSISRQFHFTFHSLSLSWGLSFHFSFSNWVKLIFISLFTSRNEWTTFSFHFHYSWTVGYFMILLLCIIDISPRQSVRYFGIHLCSIIHVYMLKVVITSRVSSMSSLNRLHKWT